MRSSPLTAVGTRRIDWTNLFAHAEPVAVMQVAVMQALPFAKQEAFAMHHGRLPSPAAAVAVAMHLPSMAHSAKAAVAIFHRLADAIS